MCVCVVCVCVCVRACVCLKFNFARMFFKRLRKRSKKQGSNNRKDWRNR